MEFRVLGPLEAEEAGILVPLGAQKQRALLAVLLLGASETVSLGRLIEDLWEGEPPERADKAIQTYVSRLRKVLPADLLCTRPHGYELRLERGCLDLHEFERLAGEGRRALAQGHLEQAAADLRGALALWRGKPFDEFDSEPFAAREGDRLGELRLAVLEDRIDVDLARGRHADVVGELESLIAHHRFRERLRGQLMLALYRSGRQAEALAAFQDARRTLVDELGIEPGRALQDLERAILRHDLSLDLRRIAQPPAMEHPAAARGVDAGAFVGRKPELERLDRALGAALSGSGRLLMLAGEPGIGKTRTAAEFAAQARSRGVRVLWGRCYETEGAPPYWPWLEALRSYLGSRDPSHLSVSPAVLAELLPELRERWPDLEPAPDIADPKEARFRLLDTTTTFFIGAARTEPLVLILDDLHAADAGSLMLLEFVAHRLGDAALLVVGTFRDVELTRGHPLSHTLAELTRERLFERLPLRGLSEADVKRYLEETLGGAPPDALVTAVHAQTEGNPLFVTEVVRLLVQEGRLTPETLLERRDWSVGVPQGVRDVLGRRLDRLSPAGNELLRLAAVIGKEFGLDQLERLSEARPEDEILQTIEEALSAHLVEEVPGEPGRYRFAHTLIQETLSAELSTTRRIRLHSRIAAALEELYGTAADAHAVELVHHFGEAETVLGADKLVHYAQVAGEQALAAHAYEEAADYFRQALTAEEGAETDERLAALHFGLARAELAARERYDLDEALAHLRCAFDYYGSVGDTRRAIEVAAHPLPPIYAPAEATELIGRALEMVAPDSLEAGKLLTTLGWFHGLKDHERAREEFGRAIRVARHHDDAALERRILVNDAHVDWWHLAWQDSLEKSNRAIDLARAGNDQRTEMVARSTALRLLAIRGELEAAEHNAEVAFEISERLRERYWLVTTRVHRMWLAVLAGDWQTARRLSDEALALQPRDARNLGNRALIECETGNVAEAKAYVERLLAATRLSPPIFPFEDAFAAVIVPLVARCLGEDSQMEATERTAQALCHSDIAPYLRLCARASLGLIAVARGDATLADEQYETLVEQQGTTLLFVGGLAVDHLLGLLFAVSRRTDDTLGHFEDALAFCQRAGYRPELAWTKYDYANALLERGAPGDTQRATALRQEALSTATELDLHALTARDTTPSKARDRQPDHSEAGTPPPHSTTTGRRF
jgi:DNA-binding SARP family transcriptional activator/tetratricopeptide (TPR) repeat protein